MRCVRRPVASWEVVVLVSFGLKPVGPDLVTTRGVGSNPT